MNTPNKPLGEWTLGELRDCCNGAFCEDCPAGHYREKGFCQFSDCSPGSWDFLDAPAETAPAPEPEADKPAKPRLAEILGVEVGEEFAIKIFGKEVSGFSVHEDGILWQGDRSSLTAECLALIINYPDQIVRLPRLTEPELAICKTLGAKWVTRDAYGCNDLRLWDSKPTEINGNYCNGPTAMSLATVADSLFPSVKPGVCMKVWG